MSHKISKKELDTLVENFEQFEQVDPPATYRATFKLSKLLAFLTEISKYEGFTADDDRTHNVAITFVREDLSNKVLRYSEKPKSNLSLFKKKYKDKEYSQVIPIITGCVATLDKDFVLEKYQHIYSDEAKTQIPFLRSGGEGTGLIPPPPRGR
ncbi:MAG: hypothetical protein JNL23_02745 [Chitinophagaceae bacterium]|nr:hypothetical protein [Chitinophagaceae bacterium]